VTASPSPDLSPAPDPSPSPQPSPSPSPSDSSGLVDSVTTPGALVTESASSGHPGLVLPTIIGALALLAGAVGVAVRSVRPF
jgi:hypothetical protein